MDKCQKNDVIDFKKTSEKEKNLMKQLYETYADIDFESIAMEKICGNIFYYDKATVDMSDEVVAILEKMDLQKAPMFVEKINGELVFS